MYFLHMCEPWTLKPVKVILKRGKGKKENNGVDESTQSILYTYMKMSQ
jgi:hypothetical protein